MIVYRLVIYGVGLGLFGFLWAVLRPVTEELSAIMSSFDMLPEVTHGHGLIETAFNWFPLVVLLGLGVFLLIGAVIEDERGVR